MLFFWFRRRRRRRLPFLFIHSCIHFGGFAFNLTLFIPSSFFRFLLPCDVVRVYLYFFICAKDYIQIWTKSPGLSMNPNV